MKKKKKALQKEGKQDFLGRDENQIQVKLLIVTLDIRN